MFNNSVKIFSENYCNRIPLHGKLNWLNSVRYWWMLKNELPISIRWCKKFMRIYALGKLPDARYLKLSAQYAGVIIGINPRSLAITGAPLI